MGVRGGQTASSDTVMNEDPAKAMRISSLFLIVKKERLKVFFSLLQEGFLCEMDPGKSLFHFLQERLGMNHPEDMARIGTVFIDEHPVDNVEKSMLEEGSTLAISGTMPDLIVPPPACRRFFPSRLPEGSRDRNQTRENKEETGMVHVKLLNTIPDDRCIYLLHKGILIDGQTVDIFFSSRKTTLIEMIVKMTLSGIEEDPEMLVNGKLNNICDLVHLVIRGCTHDSAG